MTRDFAAHLETLFTCRACPNVQGQPITGAVPGAKVLLVGQAPGPREVVERRPFAYTAGRRLFQWFSSIGVSEEQFRKRVHISAVIRCFPGRDPKAGGDRVPDATEIANCAAHLDRELRLLRPRLVIAVGTLAAKELLVGTPASSPADVAASRAATREAAGRRPFSRRDGGVPLQAVVGRVHRATRAGHTFDVIVLPHPSGRSTWTNKPEHRALLEQSLRLIAQRM